MLDEGRLVTLDLGGIYNGYCSDNRRYAYAGAIPDSLLRRYEVMVEIVDQRRCGAHSGTSYADCSSWLWTSTPEHGISALARFTHVGHNIGLETEEQWLDDNASARWRRAW